MRALIPSEGSAKVRERLLMTFFLAALVHGMLILGLTFSGDGRHDSGARGIDVLLVADELPASDHNDSAAYLAQRTQVGSGNTAARAIAHNQVNDAPPPQQTDDAQGNGLTRAAAAVSRSDEPVLTTTATRTQIRYFASTAADAAPVRHPAGDTGPLQLRGVARKELWITPDTRESIIAPYLDSWRRRVERIGTLNYPTAAKRAGVRAHPVLEVAIDADGRLAKAQIMTSSGYPDLDAAALAILKLASPFDSFPPDLAARYHTLRFAYEWQFTGGRVAPGP